MKDSRYFIINLWLVGAEGEETYSTITVKTEDGCHFAHEEIEIIVSETFPFVEFFTIMWFKEMTREDLQDFDKDVELGEKKPPEKEFIVTWNFDKGVKGCISCGEPYTPSKTKDDVHKGYCSMNCMLDDMI